MNTIARVMELAGERNLTLFRLAQHCSVPYSTLKKTEKRGGQQQIENIELDCQGLGISLEEFFTEKGA